MLTNDIEGRKLNALQEEKYVKNSKFKIQNPINS